MTRALRLVGLTLLWVALWGELSVANLAGGALVGAAVVALFDTSRDERPTVRPAAAARFGVLFAAELVRSTVSVALAVIKPRSRVCPGIVTLSLPPCSGAVVTVIADAVTLTPGTLTLEVERDPTVLHIHVLDARRRDSTEASLERLAAAALDAFGTSPPEGHERPAMVTSWVGRRAGP